MIGNHSGSPFELESSHFNRWPGNDVARRVTLKIGRNFIGAALNCKAYFFGPQYGHRNAGDFLAREEPVQLREYVS
ncbi:MAG TPA: hypothetical protein VFI45_18765 [Candidatus Acidoferrum sp.]|nr:hypothetical protein [Candidatus Acidoferrum sp.]